jgi:hypothetical protein
MPTSKKRSGYFAWKLERPVLSGIAAVIATTRGSRSASSSAAWAKTCV